MLNYTRAAVSACLVALLGALAPGARADGGVKTNFEVMQAVIGEVCGELVSGIPADLPTREIRLAPFGRDERYEMIANVLTRTLADKGYQVYLFAAAAGGDSTTAPDATSVAKSKTGMMLEFQTIEFSLRYPKIYRSFLVGGKTVKRSGDVRVLAKLVEPANGHVVWMAEASSSYDDQFSHDDLAEVEAGLYAFTKPPRESRNWGKIVEPVVVSGIIVGLIYLFFSNQGD